MGLLAEVTGERDGGERSDHGYDADLL